MTPQEIKRLIASLSPDQQAKLEERIEERRLVNRLEGRNFRTILLDQTLACLHGDRMPHMVRRRELASRVKVIK